MKLLKTSALVLVLALSFLGTTYVMGRFAASKQEQANDDFLNEKVGERVVVITGPDNLSSGGTGFFVNTPSGNTFILTNNHVCGLAQANNVLIDGEYIASIVAHSPDHDLCLVSNPLNFSGIDVAKTSRNGLNVFVIGHPMLEPKALIKGQISGEMLVTLLIGFNVPCTEKGERIIVPPPNSMASVFGIFSICVIDRDAQAVTANILPGNSGSPVVNYDGQFVGVAFAGNPEEPGRGYIIPLSYVQKFLSDK